MSEARRQTAAERWSERIAEQQRSGLSIQRFCKEQSISQYSFYAWRRRLRQPEPETVRFALVDHAGKIQDSAPGSQIEVVLTTGERLRIGVGVDAATLQLVLKALRS